jgi:hypothetical protein
MKTRKLTMVALTCFIMQDATISLALGADGQTPSQVTVTITGREPGPYKIGATVQSSAPAQNLPMRPADNSAQGNRRPQYRTTIDSVLGMNEFLRIMGPSSEGGEKPSTSASTPSTPSESTSQPPSSQRPPYLTDSSLTQSNQGSSGGFIYPTDGSSGSQQITRRAFDEFYEYLPNQVIDRLSPYGSPSESSGSSDPYADYSSAIKAGDFIRARDLANASNQADFEQRMAMLVLAGAAALRNIMDSNEDPSHNTFPARDTLGKLAEDLHYAGEGLDTSDPSDAKLKMICEDISRVWGNMAQQRQNPSSQ